jgi:hypothetical protein
MKHEAAMADQLANFYHGRALLVRVRRSVTKVITCKVDGVSGTRCGGDKALLEEN